MLCKTSRTCLAGVLTALPLVLGGCAEQLAKVGQPPELSEVKHGDLPSQQKGSERRLPGAANANRNFPDAAKKKTGQRERSGASLWRANQTPNYFADQRARHIGDILTVQFDLDDTATLENETERSRSSNENVGVDALLGYEQAISDVFPEAADAANAAQASSESSYEGSGETDREEEVEFELAAMVVDRLPSGHFVIRGRQEIRVNYELRDLQVSGIVRPQDIGADNTIGYEKIAEARVSYGGRGDITNVQQPRYGQQILDALLPF